MLKKRDRDILMHVIEYCDDIKSFIARFDDTLETLVADKLFKHSVSMCVLQIGELTHHLTTEFTKANSMMPWKDIRELRNIAAHRYKDFDLETLHDTIINRVPELREYCQKLLDQNADGIENGENKPAVQSRRA